MDFNKYLSDCNADEFTKDKTNFSEENLIEKKTILLTSVALGVFGIDRYILGDKARGVAKGVTFVSLFIAIISLMFVIVAKVYSAYGNIVGQSVTITWADNVAIIGQGMANLVYSLIGLFVLYIAFAIVDGFLCYYKNMDINYRLLKNQIK